VIGVFDPDELGRDARFLQCLVQDLRLPRGYQPVFLPVGDERGRIAGKAFYYVANSQAYSFNPDGKLFPFEKLKDVVILPKLPIGFFLLKR
jgi:hypothetical protein